MGSVHVLAQAVLRSHGSTVAGGACTCGPPVMAGRGGSGVSPGGVHHVTIAGMVQAPLDSNAYGVLRVYPERLELEGFGTQVESRVMLCRDATPSASARL